jgi:hypothetical protein
VLSDGFLVSQGNREQVIAVGAGASRNLKTFFNFLCFSKHIRTDLPPKTIPD